MTTLDNTKTDRRFGRPLMLLAALATITLAPACGPAQASGTADRTSSDVEAIYADPSAIREAVYKMERAYAKVNDYTTTFSKRERVKGKMLPKETMQLKFKKPFAVYLKWTEGKKKDQESLFVKGWNNGKIRAHPGSFPDITVNLKPDSSLAMRGNRHPITEAGIGNTIKLIVREVRRSESRGDVKFIDHGTQTINGARSRCVEAVMPTNASAGYYAHRAKICIDMKTDLPNHVQIWNHQNVLIEDYGYKRTRINVGLGEADFDPDNPAYGF